MKNLFTILIAVFLTANIFAQSPEKMKYQAVIRDSNGHVIVSQAIGMQISILQGDLPGTVVYTETQSLLSNANGLTSTEIGTGTVVFGDFSTINWANGPFFMQIETDPSGGSNYTITGVNQLLSVPYAMHAKTADSLTNIDNFSWSISGNAGTDPATNFIGTTDDQALIFKVNNVRAGKISSTSESTSYGFGAGGDSGFGIFMTAIGRFSLSNNTGNYNTATGFSALKTNTTGGGNTAFGRSALYDNTTGNWNTALGDVALSNNVAGSSNTAIGNGALNNNTQSYNTATGFRALYSNTIGVVNTASGYQSLYSNTTGNHNTANGNEALYSNTSGHWNTAVGSGALQSNTTGDVNTAIGFTALYNNTIGSENTAIGRTALYSNTSGDFNTANGKSALYYNTIGYENTAIGYKALLKNTEGLGNTAIGFDALYDNTEGDKNTAVGRYALADVTTGSNNIGIGNNAQVPSATASYQVRVGSTLISYAGIQVSWSITSDKIWKEQIRELPYGLDMLMQLKPVDYHRKNNEVKTREMGFIAQDVEVLLKEIGYDDQGFLTKDDKGHLSLRYNDFIALLTKGMQEQQELIEILRTENQQMIENLAKINTILELNAQK